MTELRPTYQASKWIDARFLIDVEEMEQLLATLQPFAMYITNGVSERDQGIIPHDHFLECYRHYVEALKQGEIPNHNDYRTAFSSSWSRAEDHLYTLPVGENQQLIRVQRPVLQLQSHSMHFSTADNTFRSMVYGSDSVLWGLQISYPQIFRNHTTHQVDKVVNSPEFPNTQLFRTLQDWLRTATIPTPFIVTIDGVETRINSPMRLGKQCLKWIFLHPQLKAKSIRIYTR
jgi:hypothetical protein